MTSSTKARPHIAIIGGGLAGLSAASELSFFDCRVTLLESRQTLGGRASSFQDADTGDIIDNCQHVTMGCCTELARFCSQNGLSEMLRKQRTLYFADEAGRISKLPIDPLPSPLHLTRAFARMGFLTYAERMRVAWGMLRLFSTRNYNRGSFLNWLQENRQNQRTIDRFWSVVLISALNETLDRIEFRYARQVIIEGFLANHKAPVIEIPDVPLGDLYGAKLKSTLEHRGVDFHINTSVAELQFASGQVAAIRCRSGENFTADHYVLAVPPQRVLDLISSDEIRARMEFAQIASFEYSPITSVHMWFDRPVMTAPNVAIVGTTVQWLFAKQSNASESNHYAQAVISASRDLASMGKEKIAEHILAEVKSILPAARNAELIRIRVVTERHATFSILPGIDSIRPDQKTSVANLWLAGDYTQTGWPATMEGAVRSGQLAARSIASLGKLAPASR